MEKARLDGQLEEVDKKVRTCKYLGVYNVAVSSLASKEMKQAEQIYRDVIVDKMVVQETITDLDKYTKCLDSSIIQFHSNKMTAINEILDDLWRKIGFTRSEGVSAGEKRKAYDYRVVMLVEGGIEIDMRERCSAGQKMLASILIRIALADVFGGMCSIIALDEPTTNLDSCKVEHMAEMLNDLIAARRNDDSQGISIGKQFQVCLIILDIVFMAKYHCFSPYNMIVITHDERLVDKLMLGSRPEYIYVLGKDARGLSYVKRQYPDGLVTILLKILRPYRNCFLNNHFVNNYITVYLFGLLHLFTSQGGHCHIIL
uniref:SMC_N domain-containing protein n=1 Tax=Heterorhabditis bacteriophora TaxID=37862 RepID=A0A1I7XLY5_HETBA